jgi:4-carboxymuconolactone decarboxylase
MANVPYIEPDDMTGNLQVLLNGAPPLNLFKALANSEGALTGLFALGSAFIKDTTLDQRLRELIILRVGIKSDAAYEVYQHKQVARSIGIPDAKVQALAGSPDAKIFTAIEQDLLRLTDELMDNVKASPEVLAPVAATLSNAELIEALTVIGAYMMVCRLLENLEIDLEDDEIMTRLKPNDSSAVSD